MRSRNNKNTFQWLLFSVLMISAFVLPAQQDSVQLVVKQLGASDILNPQNPADIEVVTASRSGQSISSLPITVHVITKQEIQLNGYTTLVDALKSAPGMKVSKVGSGEEGELFIMRGLVGNQYAKILINGVPVQPSVKGSIGIGEQLPIAQAERIEIIYGAASSVYGLDAMAGVINIITQKAGDGTLAHANIIVGRDNYRHVDFTVGGKAGKNKSVFQYMIYGSTGQRDDLNINRASDVFYTPDYLVEAATGSNPFAPISQGLLDTLTSLPDSLILGFYRLNGAQTYDGTVERPILKATPQQSYSLGLKLNYKNLQFTFDEMYRRDHSSLGREAFIFSYSNPGNFIGERIQRTTLTYQNSWDKFDLTTNVSYLRYRMDFLSSFGVNYATGFGRSSFVYEASDDIFAETLINYTPNKRWNLLLGAAYQRSGNFPLTNDLSTFFDTDDYQPFSNSKPEDHPRYGSFGYNPQSFTNTSFFFQAFHQKGKFSFIGGIRGEASTNYDTDKLREAFDSFTLPFPLITRFGLVYKTGKKSALRFSASTGFRAPPASLEYSSLALPAFNLNGIIPDSISYQRIPNEGLLPEISNSIELGYRNTLSDRFYLDIALFANSVSNSIDPEFVEIDQSIYPFAAPNARVNGQNIPLARTYVNDSSTLKGLVGLQVIFRAKDVLPIWDASFDTYLTLSAGFETFPVYSAADTFLVGGEIESLRGTPSVMSQFNLSLKPANNWYLRFEALWMGNWTRRGIASEFQATNELFVPTTSGFFNLDIVTRYQVNKNLQAFVKVMNVFNKDYGGIGATGLDVDLFYNPQMLRNIQFGITFNR